jgi:hypothetical protein
MNFKIYETVLGSKDRVFCGGGEIPQKSHKNPPKIPLFYTHAVTKELASWVSQARLPRTEPSTELITAHKGNSYDAHAAGQTRDFSALPKHREVSSCCRLPYRQLVQLRERLQVVIVGLRPPGETRRSVILRGGPFPSRRTTSSFDADHFLRRGPLPSTRTER